jgi:hypothetical protein
LTAFSDKIARQPRRMAAAPDTASSAEDLEQHFFPGNELLMSRPAPYRWGNISSSFCLYFV